MSCSLRDGGTRTRQRTTTGEPPGEEPAGTVAATGQPPGGRSAAGAALWSSSTTCVALLRGCPAAVDSGVMRAKIGLRGGMGAFVLGH